MHRERQFPSFEYIWEREYDFSRAKVPAGLIEQHFSLA